MEGFLIWIVIMVIVGISKLVEKLKQANADSPTSSSPSRRSAHRRSPSRPSGGHRPPPPVILPPPIGQERMAPTEPRPVVQQSNEWDVSEQELRRFLGQLTGSIEPEPVRVPEPQVPLPLPPPPAPTVPQAPQAIPAPARSRSRAAQWAAAMRDRNNLRNTIIAAEILGRPKGF